MNEEKLVCFSYATFLSFHMQCECINGRNTYFVCIYSLLGKKGEKGRERVGFKGVHLIL